MPTFTTHKKVAHSPRQMFDLVSNIESYPEFLPMCEALEIKSSKQQDDKVLCIADMTIGYKMIHETFTTQVYLQPQEYLIDVKYIDGPFRYLENRWAFHDVENDINSCDIEFFIDYEFKNRMLGMVMGSMFDIAFRKFSDAFEKRANEIYGVKSAD